MTFKLFLHVELKYLTTYKTLGAVVQNENLKGYWMVAGARLTMAGGLGGMSICLMESLALEPWGIQASSSSKSNSVLLTVNLWVTWGLAGFNWAGMGRSAVLSLPCSCISRLLGG